MSLIDNPEVQLWLTQFSEDERPIARKILEKFSFVPVDEFQRDLSRLVEVAFPPDESVAFFIERELPNLWYRIRKPLKKKIVRDHDSQKSSLRKVKRPQRMYKEIRIDQGKGFRKRSTAFGAALPAVRSPTNNRQKIGSEGIVASLLSKVCEREPGRYFLHPSASLIRAKKIQRFVIATDFIGSGTRINSMLASLWFLKSVRSWFNGGLIKFSVLCYSGTTAGIKAVGKHRVKPTIHKVRACPTIFNSFTSTERAQVIDLCKSRFKGKDDPLGYKDTGALLAFQHSCPNNVPAIFIRGNGSRHRPWHPLFPARTSAAVAAGHSPASPIEVEKLSLSTLKFSNIAASLAYQRASRTQRHAIIVTAALRRGHRTLDELSTITGWPVWLISTAIQSAQSSGLVDNNRRVTKPGLRLINRLDKATATSTLSVASKSMYYPKSLRAQK